jgi:hypothetical protein
MVRHTGLRSCVRVVVGGVWLSLVVAGGLSASAQSLGVSVDQFTQTGILLRQSTSGRVFNMPPTYNGWQLVSGWDAQVQADGMTYQDPASAEQLATAGGRVVPSGPWQPSFYEQNHWTGSGHAIQNGSTFWGSFLLSMPAWAGPWERVAVGLKVSDTDWSNVEYLWIGQFGSMMKMVSSEYLVDRQEVPIGPLPSADGEPTLVLFRVESTPSGLGTVSVWLNPPLSGPLPAPAAVLNNWNMRSGVQATAMRLNGYEGLSLDEVRLGPTAATVLPRRTFTWSSSDGGNGHRYELVASPTPLTWTQARDAAASMGGWLADLTSQAEHAFVTENLIGREAGWDFHVNEWGWYRLHGPWIGAHRQQSESLDHTGGWSWVSGEPWSFTSWDPLAASTDYRPSYDRVCLSLGWNQPSAASDWTITSDSGFDRIRGYVVEYPALPVGPAVPDVVITGELPYTVTLMATLPPGSTGLQWWRGGVPLTDGNQANSQTISGSATNELTIQGLNLDGLGEYEIRAIDDAGMPLSHRGRIRIDATQQSFVTCLHGMPIYRVFTAPSGAVTSEQARQHAASLGGRLATSDWIQHQQVIDAMTCDEALHTIDSRPFAAGPVGPWIGGVKTDGTSGWRWPNGAWVAGTSPWAPGMPRSLWEWDPAASMHLTPAAPGSSSMLWADMFASEEASSTLPNSYVVEWASPFEEPAEVIPVEGDCGGALALEVTLAAHGVVGSYLWFGPAGYLQDGTTPNGTVVSGSSTLRLELSPLAPGDAGYYFPIFVTQSGCGLQGAYFQVTVGECGTACPADFNQDGGIDGGDIDAFFGAWEAGDGAADVNQDGGVDFGDVDTFFVAWENGGC